MFSNQRQTIEQAKFIYSLLEKAFKKQTKTIINHGEKHVEALVALKSEESKESAKSTEGLFQKKWEMLNEKI